MRNCLTWQAHAGLHQNSLQHDIMLVEVPEDVGQHPFRPVGSVLNAVISSP